MRPSLGIGLRADLALRDDAPRPIVGRVLVVILGVALALIVLLLLALGILVTRLRSTATAEPPTALNRAPKVKPAARSWKRRLALGGTGSRTGKYEWEPRTRQLYRAWKRVPGPTEDLEAILAFLETHQGVEAYVEPRTVLNPLSVVLVDVDGEWRRFELREDAPLRELARERNLRVIDAARFGYPDRMRRPRPPAGGS